MALRIGLLILASCNLYNADLITLNRPVITSPPPVFSFPNNDGHHDMDNQHTNEGPKLGAYLKPLGYNSQKQQQKTQSKVVVVSQRNWVHGSNWESRVRNSSRSAYSSHKNSSVDVKSQKPVVQGKRGVVAVQTRPAIIAVQPVPRPSVVVSTIVIGNNAVHSAPIKIDDDNINVNKTPVNFGSLRYVDNHRNNQSVKAPITVVTVPQISTAKPTQHKVATNQVINQSNIPSIHENRNRLADQLLFTYNNLLKTKIKQIVDVPTSTKTPIPAPVRSPLVQPGKLEHIVEGQLRVGERNQNQPIVIQKLLTTINQHVEDCDQDHDHSVHVVVQGNRKI